MTSPVVKEALRDLDLTVQETRRVLLVDDEPSILELLAAALGSDCQVSTSRDGQAALELLEQREFDLVISDQRMPGMTGVELLTVVAERWPRTMRVILTGFEDTEPMLEAINAGQVYRYLIKPFNVGEMRALVDEALLQRTNTKALDLVVTRLAEQGAALNRTHGQIVAAEEDLAKERLKALWALIERVAVDARGHLAMARELREVSEQETVARDISLAIERVHLASGAAVDLLACMAEVAAARDAPVRRGGIPARQLVEEAVATFHVDPARGEREVSLTIEEELGTLRVDVATVRQAILALLHNAALGSGPGQPIELELGGHGRTGVCLEVRDQGAGMDPEVLARAKDPLYTAFEVEGGSGSSLGLGLSIVELAAEAHGGRLELESVPAKGTVARMILADAHLERSDRLKIDDLEQGGGAR
jgi:signal transduction histidine kinase